MIFDFRRNSCLSRCFKLSYVPCRARRKTVNSELLWIDFAGGERLSSVKVFSHLMTPDGEAKRGYSVSLRPLTAQERAVALQKATKARTIRATAKQGVKTGQKSVADVISAAEKEEALGRLKVSELLESLPGVGQVRASAIMGKIGISPSRRVRGLGVHQRKALIDLLNANNPHHAG